MKFDNCIKLILAIVLVFNIGAAQAQKNLITKLADYKKLLDSNQFEKVHIHTNQPFYMAYDTIWFKGYVINANFKESMQKDK